MKEDNNMLDQLFRGRLADYEQLPPEEVWTAIENDIAKNRKKPVIPFYFRIAAGIIILLGLGTLTWKYLGDKSASDYTAQTKVTTSNSSVTQNNNTSDLAKSSNRDNRIKSANENSPLIPSLGSKVESTIAMKEETIFIHEVLLVDAEQDYSNAQLILVDEITNQVSSSSPQPITFKETNIRLQNPDDLIIQQNLIALAEKAETSGERTKAWSIGGQAGPQYSYRYVDVNSQEPYMNNNNKNDYEDPVFAYAGGFQVEMESGNRFAIQSGIYYSKIGHRRSTEVDIDPTQDITSSWFDPSFEELNYVGAIEGSKREEFIQGNNDYPDITGVDRFLEFVEIPFIVSYQLVDNKLGIDISSGIWADFLVGNKAYLMTSQSTRMEYSNSNINTFNISASVGVGLNYPVMPRLTFSLEPVFKYYLSPINADPSVNVYPYALGLMSGLIYTF